MLQGRLTMFFISNLKLKGMDSPATEPIQFCLCWLNWPSYIAGGFYAVQSRISKHTYSEHPKHEIQSFEGLTN